EQIQRIRDQVGDGKVICGLSGGVDSSVAALLVHRAIGDQLTCVFVDHGLMRKNEGAQVVEAFRDHFEVPLVAVDAEDRFLDKLAGVSEPEAKRKIIGAEFIRVFEEEAAKLGDAKFLVQGTLYSDVIESGGGTGAATIKSHHNVGGLPDVRTVGVQGDERTYGYVVVIRAVTSDDAMTADWARLPYDLLEQIASRMINELRDVNRVVLDITSKPPGTIEWE